MGKESPVFVYFSQSTKKLLFFEPEITTRNLLVLRFDKNKKLNKLEKFSLSDGKNFELSNKNTTLDIREQSMIGSLFSNIGINNAIAPVN
jgi:outer membrane protein assembly factor BamE (lipoprotein component of BamABCDE complex)